MFVNMISEHYFSDPVTSLLLFGKTRLQFTMYRQLVCCALLLGYALVITSNVSGVFNQSFV